MPSAAARAPNRLKNALTPEIFEYPRFASRARHTTTEWRVYAAGLRGYVVDLWGKRCVHQTRVLQLMVRLERYERVARRKRQRLSKLRKV
jgi:hypothetical protein